MCDHIRHRQVAHWARHDNVIYIDTPCIQEIMRLGNWTVDHAGFGDFRAVTEFLNAGVNAGEGLRSVPMEFLFVRIDHTELGREFVANGFIGRAHRVVCDHGAGLDGFEAVLKALLACFQVELLETLEEVPHGH